MPDEVVAIIEKMMAKKPADRFQTAQEVVAALKPYCKRRPVEFDFRQLVTLRAKQARDRDKVVTPGKKKRASTNSSITSTAGWLNNPSHHLQAELDTLSGDDTPAIRQQASRPSRSNSSVSQSTPSHASVKRGTNVPKGWSVRTVKSGRSMPLTRVKTRIGTSAECEIKLTGTVADSRQCYIEFDGTNWKLHQESRKTPTFVNGKNETHKTLKHGSKITFTDGTGLLIFSKEEAEREKKRRKTLLLILGLGVAAGVIAVAAMKMMG